jgi:hypothetical protein
MDFNDAEATYTVGDPNRFIQEQIYENHSATRAIPQLHSPLFTLHTLITEVFLCPNTTTASAAG